LGFAVLLPEVFLKAVSVVRNLGVPLRPITTANFDFIQHYRPLQNVVKRPTASAAGKTQMFPAALPLRDTMNCFCRSSPPRSRTAARQTGKAPRRFFAQRKVMTLFDDNSGFSGIPQSSDPLARPLHRSPLRLLRRSSSG